MADFQTTEYAQMRRCRMAHLHGEMIDECFGDDQESVTVNGYVHSIRPDLTCWPMRWSITVETYSRAELSLALAG
ncbi:MAG: hypothetical protein ABW003_01650 [Microvirga sp.]